MIETEKLNRYDYCLFYIIFIGSYFDTGVWGIVTSFSPTILAIGSSFVSFLVSLYLFQYSFRRHFVILSRSFYFLVVLATFYSFIIFIVTVWKTGFSETLVIYRKNYILLPTFLYSMGYMSSMSLERIEQLFKLILKWLVPLTVIYLIECMGFNLFNTIVHKQTAGDVEVVRNILGMPPVFPAIFALCFIWYLYDKSRIMLVYVGVCAVICFFSFTRNIIASAIIIMTFSMIMYSFKFGIRDNLKILLYGCIAVGVLMIVFPLSFNFWNNLIHSTRNQLETSSGTYAVRQALIDKALLTIRNADSYWDGIGYIRDVKKGDYSFVLGGDTFIAPILWCEGILGLILRCLPPIYLLFKSIINYWKYPNSKIGMLSLVILVTILSQVPNYVQTTIFTKYTETIALLYIMYIYILKIKKDNKLC